MPSDETNVGKHVGGEKGGAQHQTLRDATPWVCPRTTYSALSSRYYVNQERTMSLRSVRHGVVQAMQEDVVVHNVESSYEIQEFWFLLWRV